MENFWEIFVNNPSFWLLSGFLMAALFFLMVGIRELKQHAYEGLLYIVISLFFVVAHIFYLFNIPNDNLLLMVMNQISFWHWAFMILAPVLIVLYLLLGLFHFLAVNIRVGLLKIFFGLTLLCYLFMLGTNWPLDVKGILTFIWFFIWFEVELSTAS